MGPIIYWPDFAIVSFVIMVQMNYLNRWLALEMNHSATSYDAAEALIGSMLRLPVTEGSKVSTVHFPGHKAFLNL